jgi:hypothetical protein
LIKSGTLSPATREPSICCVMGASRNPLAPLPGYDCLVVGSRAVLVGSVSSGNWSASGGWRTCTTLTTVCSGALSRSKFSRPRSIATGGFVERCRRGLVRPSTSASRTSSRPPRGFRTMYGV